MAPQSLSSTIDFLRQHAPFDQMEAVHLEYLAKRVKLVFYGRDEVIFGPNDGPANRFHIIKQGQIRGESNEGGKSSTAWELAEGECFPIGALLAKRPVRMTYRATEECFCYELDRTDFDKLIQQSGVFHDFATRRMANLLDKALQGIQAHSASRISESNSLNTPIQKLIQRRPVCCTPTTPLKQALEQMAEARIGSIIIIDAERRPEGVFTLHDLLSRVAIKGHSLNLPISEVMTHGHLSLAPEQPAYEAALMMTRHGIGHLCVVDTQGRLVGVISERDLFSLQRVGLVSLSRAISHADSTAALAKLEQDIHQLVEQMIAQGVSVDQLTRLIAALNDAITERVIQLVLEETGNPTVPFSWLAFGSEGRQEQTLKTDQDNGILFISPVGLSNEEVRAQLLPLATRINAALDECGFPLCPGNVMASNPECCLSLNEWQHRFERWIDVGTPENLLKASIFFDFRTLYGDDQPVEQLRASLFKQSTQNSRFRRQLAANAMSIRPPLGLFKDFKLTSGGKHPKTIDLKLHGLTPFVDSARIMSLAHGVNETNTLDRLQTLAASGKMNRDDVAAWVRAYQFIQLLRMRHHYDLAEAGQPLDNNIDPEQLNDLDRRILKEAFRQARKLQSKLAVEYQL